MAAMDNLGVWIGGLSGAEEETSLRAWYDAHPAEHRPIALRQLDEEVRRLAFVDLDRADRLAQVSSWMAEELGDPASRALSSRCLGHVCFVRARYAEALQHYRRAITLLESIGQELDAARTMLTALQCLIYLDHYELAEDWARKARGIFERHGDDLRLARLASNFGNVLYRQDRHEQALLSYQQAFPVLRRLGNARDVAAVFSNMAVCYTSLGHFRLAHICYRRARRHCWRNNLPVLVAAAEYNIAYLFFLQGEYLRAARLYQASRLHCQQTGDAYHAALCDLDEAEVYLELNRNEDGAHLARRAAGAFAQLGMPYERAKAFVSLAVALSRSGQNRRASRTLADARRIFAHEKNCLWPALIDLYLAIIWQHQGEPSTSDRLCRRAYKVLSGSLMPGKASLCELLMGQLALEKDDLAAARRWCGQARARLDGSATMVLQCHVNYLEGRIEERAGNPARARERYQQARHVIESLRNRLWDDDIRISFLKDKVTVYESLIALCLANPRDTAAEALEYIEQAKSRSLAERLSVAHDANPRTRSGSADLQLSQIRCDLNATYRQIEAAALRGSSQSARNVAALQLHMRERERLYLRRLAESADLLDRSDRPAAVLGWPALVKSVPAGAALINYFEVRGVLHICLIQEGQVHMLQAGPAEQARGHLRLLQLQLAKFRLGDGYLTTFQETWQAATTTHLKRLHDAVFAPVRRYLNAGHLIVSPHGFLHQLPFHALHDGERFLIDDFTISYAPSASVFALCQSRHACWEDRSLVMGVSDARAPQIAEEARLAAAQLPRAQLYLGDEATLEMLRAEGSRCRFIHVASHGLFRLDNPAFSSIRIGGGQISVLDLQGLRLEAELVTLSGCGTGLNGLQGGDELIGLMRGLLSAGARSVLLSLWDVHDRGTELFFAAFYRLLPVLNDNALALQGAIREVRAKYPHPYYWAPFVLIGSYENYTR